MVIPTMKVNPHFIGRHIDTSSLWYIKVKTFARFSKKRLNTITV